MDELDPRARRVRAELHALHRDLRAAYASSVVRDCLGRRGNEIKSDSLDEKQKDTIRYDTIRYDDEIVSSEVEKSLFEKKIEKKEGKAYNKQGASKRPNVEV